jgi:hypothetical protein
MGERGMHIGYWWEIQKEGDHWEDQDVGVWTILGWILDRMKWYGLARSGSGQGPVEGSCERGNELSGSIKRWEVAAQLAVSQRGPSTVSELIEGNPIAKEHTDPTLQNKTTQNMAAFKQISRIKMPYTNTCLFANLSCLK